MASPVQNLSTAEAARQLDITASTLRRWAKAGRISVILLPSGRMRVPASEVKRCLTPTRFVGAEATASAA